MMISERVIKKIIEVLTVKKLRTEGIKVLLFSDKVHFTFVSAINNAL